MVEHQQQLLLQLLLHQGGWPPAPPRGPPQASHLGALAAFTSVHAAHAQPPPLRAAESRDMAAGAAAPAAAATSETLSATTSRGGPRAKQGVQSKAELQEVRQERDPCGCGFDLCHKYIWYLVFAAHVGRNNTTTPANVTLDLRYK